MDTKIITQCVIIIWGNTSSVLGDGLAFVSINNKELVVSRLNAQAKYLRPFIFSGICYVIELKV